MLVCFKITEECLYSKTDVETTEIIANARKQNNKFLCDIKCRNNTYFIKILTQTSRDRLMYVTDRSNLMTIYVFISNGI